MISISEVKKVADLAKLDLNEEQLAMYSKQLSSINDMIDDLKDVDCSSVEPLTSVCGGEQRVREDLVTESDITDKLFANAPGSSSDLSKEIKCFVVPKVVE